MNMVKFYQFFYHSSSEVYLLCNIFLSKIIFCNNRKLNDFFFKFQVDLTEPILSRFDILCIVRDQVDPTEVSVKLI